MSKNNPSQKSIEYWKRILNDQNVKGEFIWLNHIKTTNTKIKLVSVKSFNLEKILK